MARATGAGRLACQAINIAAGRVHPMAFEFPTRSPDEIFFPTAHIHDGACHALPS